jgi:hypothetical protein
VQFVPIPTTKEGVEENFPLWFPFLKDISKRSKEPITDLMRQVKFYDVQIALVWDEDNNKATALIGIRYFRRGDELIADIIWLTGRGMKQWTHLLPQMEKYLKEHVGCAIIRPICRPGWSRLIKSQGYKLTHYVMEKPL